MSVTYSQMVKKEIIYVCICVCVCMYLYREEESGGEQENDVLVTAVLPTGEFV